MVAMGPPGKPRYQFSGPQALVESTGLLDGRGRWAARTGRLPAWDGPVSRRFCA